MSFTVTLVGKLKNQKPLEVPTYLYQFAIKCGSVFVFDIKIDHNHRSQCDWADNTKNINIAGVKHG